MTKATDPDLSREEILSLLQYDAGSGQIFWRKVSERSHRVKVGDLAGHITPSGHIRITLGRKRILAHRIAWLIVYGEWPKGFIDHRDGNGLNNRIGNLRMATPSQNSMNVKRRADNTSGCRGVHKNNMHIRRRKPWVAQIRNDGKLLTLGHFATVEEAIEARKRAEIVYYGEFTRSGT